MGFMMNVRCELKAIISDHMMVCWIVIEIEFLLLDFSVANLFRFHNNQLCCSMRHKANE